MSLQKFYPKMLYSATEPAIVVQNPAEHDERRKEGWSETPVATVDPLAELRAENAKLKAENETLRNAMALLPAVPEAPAKKAGK